MFASQAMLDTTANNISNVNTPGYSRQQVELATESGMYTGAGFFGRGVRIATVTRSTNEFLIKEANVNTASSAADQTRLGKLEQLEKILPTGENGLGYAATQFLNTFVDVSNQPQDMSARQVALSRAQEWANRVNTAAKQLDQQQAGVIMDMQTSVSQVNSLTQKIAGLNQQIAVYNGSGHTANDLLDQRDNLIKDLNKLVQVNTVEADDGSLSVFMGGGQVLVLSNTAQTLQVERDALALDAPKGRVALVTNGTSRVLDSGQITGGALQGLLRYQDEDLTGTRAELEKFVKQFADQVNTIQSYGRTPDDAPGDPIFSNTDSPNTLKVNLSNPKDLAAASPLIAYASTANTGTASVGGVSMTGTLSVPPGSTMPLTVEFLTVGAGLEYKIYPSSGPVPATSTPWVPGTALDGSSFDPPFSLNLNGAPAPGDTLTIQTITASTLPGNNGNALAMLALRDQAFVSIDSGLGNATVTDAYAQMIGNLGVIVQDGRTSASISRTLEDSSNQTLSSTAGVNLDEEASRLIQFQQSYQAAAKVLQVAQTVFDTLLNITR
jgi:flagellar hook-associated protein 1 FlgK